MNGALKILGINGSPRKANTDILLDVAMESVAGENVETEILYLRKFDIVHSSLQSDSRTSILPSIPNIFKKTAPVMLTI